MDTMRRIIILTLCFLCAICHAQAQRKPQIDRSRFEISSSSANFNEGGGRKTFTVTADKEWSVQQKPASWAKLTKNGNTLSLSVEANPSTNQRTTSFAITSLGRIIKVGISQSGASVLNVSSTNVRFGASGNSKTLAVTSSKSWEIGGNTVSWLHLSKSGSSLIIRVDANSRALSRNASFNISSGRKRINITVTQSGAPAKFNISATSANFGADGGTKTFTVTSTNSWTIDTNTASWGHLTRSGNTLTLKVDANDNLSSRNDYFIVKSGDKTIRVNILQSGSKPTSPSTTGTTPQKFEISTTSASFNAKGGSQSFIVTSDKEWGISTNTASWGHLIKNGNILILRVDKNTTAQSRTDFFVIQSGDKTIRVNISQSAGVETLSVNGLSTGTSIFFYSYGGKNDITVNTNMDGYEIKDKPYWCYILDKSATGFKIGCYSNNSGYDRRDYMIVKSGSKEIRINIVQYADYDKKKRRTNGGWVNMSIGLEGCYNVGGNNSWTANGVVGLRIGNYRDIVQLEIGAAPGVITSFDENTAFHLPLYGALKLSVRSGKLYMKLGGAYNVVRDKYYEGDYSLRAGFGSAWKHFEWDWAYVQFNAPSKYWDDSPDILDTSNMFVGMRMAWYITQ